MHQAVPPSSLDTRPARAVRVASIGGGTGLPNLLCGIRQHHPRVDVTAIVTTFDDGGSSGILRRQLGLPGVGDIRRCLIALADKAEGSRARAIAEVMGHRFPSDAGMDGHSLGNLVLAGLTRRHGSLSAATHAISDMLQITGSVIPVANEPGVLRALLHDGTWVESESAIDVRACDESSIRRVELSRPVAANAEALRALTDADVITLGPGDLYTSVIANLLPDGIPGAINRSGATVVYIGNILNKPAEAANFRASDYLRAVNGYLHSSRVDVALFNRPTASGPDAALAVDIDADANDLVAAMHVGDYRSDNDPARHDPHKLAAALMSVIESRAS